MTKATGVLTDASSIRSGVGKIRRGDGSSAQEAPRTIDKTAGSGSSVASCEAASGLGQQSTQSAPTPISGVPHTVLFLSDDDYFRSMMRAYLEHMGFRVLSCAKSRFTSEIFLRGPRVNLLLIDMHALGTSAVLLASEITDADPSLPVIFICEPNCAQDTLDAIARRGWEFLTKPLLLPELLGLIRKALDQQPSSGLPVPISRPSPPAKGSPRAEPNRREAAPFSFPVSGGLKALSGLLKVQGTTS